MPLDNPSLPVRHPDGLGPLLGRHPLMTELFTSIEQVARSSLPVVVTGHTGTGKELVSRLLHAASASPGRLLTLNVHTVPETLAEAELFGVVRGAYTGATVSRAGLVAAAGEGTLVLDEASDLPHAIQAKLLRTLEGGEVRALGGARLQRVAFRLVICTQEDPAQLAADGRWRPDFFFRVAGCVLRVPQLRDRLSDLELLARHLSERCGASAPDRETLKLLADHTWPGNVRELGRVLEHAATFSDHRRIEVDGVRRALEALRVPPATGDWQAAATLREAERAHIERVLLATAWDVESAGRILGVSRSALYRRIQQHGLHARPALPVDWMMPAAR